MSCSILYSDLVEFPWKKPPFFCYFWICLLPFRIYLGISRLVSKVYIQMVGILLVQSPVYCYLWIGRFSIFLFKLFREVYQNVLSFWENSFWISVWNFVYSIRVVSIVHLFLLLSFPNWPRIPYGCMVERYLWVSRI